MKKNKTNKDVGIRKPTKKEVIIYASVFSFLLLVFGFYMAITAVARWFDTHTIVRNQMVKVEFKKPLEFISKTEYEKRLEEDRITTELAEKCVADWLNPKDAVLTSNSISPVVFFDRIWKQESSRGADKTQNSLHMSCRAKGMYNEIGYNPQDKYCFRDEEEARLFVSLYLKRNCSGATLDQCLCYWNKGSKDDSCAYSKGNLSEAN